MGLFDSESELADFRAAGPSCFHQLRVQCVQRQRKQPALMELRCYEGTRVGGRQIERKGKKKKNNSANAQCGGRCDSAAGSSCLTGTFSGLHVAGRKENSGAVDGHAGRPYAAMYEEAAK